ncbi:MAG: SDR family oxidoreductase [Pseudomonadota bacterium]
MGAQAPHPFDLSGRVAVVTGGAGGLGFGMAETLARCGCAVSLWARREEMLEAAREALAPHGAAVHVRRTDVSDPADVDAAMTETLEALGRVDGMFANAGVGGGVKPFADRTLEEWRALLATNLEGVVLCLQAAVRHMQARAKAGDAFGRLVATSSVASIDGAAFNEHYGASKGALNSLVRALAVEQARHGITANAILPGYAESEMTAGMFDNDKFMAAVPKRIPARRFGKPSDYGGIAAYLMSDLSGYHTGDTFVIDGGYTIF